MSTFPFHLNLPATNVFIETGTGAADSSLPALRYYRDVHTMDIMVHQHVGKIHHPLFHFTQGDSRVVLPTILAALHERATFWLDAHPNDFEVATWPLLDEIRLIASHPIKTHNILIDDADIVFMKGYSNHIVNLLTGINEAYRLNMVVISQIRALDTLVATTEKIHT